MVLRSLTFASLIGLASFATGCSQPTDTEEPEVEPAPFAFQTIDAVALRGAVLVDGAPLSGVLVHVRRVDESGVSGSPIATMLTDEAGHLAADFAWDAEMTEVELVVIKAGFAGELPGDERAQLGAFAPAARIRLAAEDLSDLTIHLEPVQ